MEQDLVVHDDGFYYLCPVFGKGMLSARDLRKIADRLDELNDEYNRSADQSLFWQCELFEIT